MTSPSRCHPICPWYLPVTFCPMFRFFLLLPMSMAVQRCHPSLRWSPERPLVEEFHFEIFQWSAPKSYTFIGNPAKVWRCFSFSQMLNVWYIHLHLAIFIVNVGKCTMHWVSRFSERDIYVRHVSDFNLKRPFGILIPFIRPLELMVWFFPLPVDFLFCFPLQIFGFSVQSSKKKKAWLPPLSHLQHYPRPVLP